MPVFANVLVILNTLRSHTLRIVSFDLPYILKCRTLYLLLRKLKSAYYSEN